MRGLPFCVSVLLLSSGAEGPLRLEYGGWDRRLLRVEVPVLPPAGSRPPEENEVVREGDAWCRSRALLGVREQVRG